MATATEPIHPWFMSGELPTGYYAQRGRMVVTYDTNTTPLQAVLPDSAVGLDSFDGRWTTPRWKKAAVLEGWYAAPDPAALSQSAVTLDQWGDRWTSPRWARVAVREGCLAQPSKEVFGSADVTLDEWDGRWTTPRWARVAVREGFFSAPASAPLAESVVSIDQWGFQPPGPRRPPAGDAAGGRGRTQQIPGRPVLPPPDLQLDWQPAWTAPLRPAARRPFGGSVWLDPVVGVVLLDQWDGRWTTPRWGHKPRPEGGAVMPDPASLSQAGVTLDQWGAFWSVPRWVPARRPEGGAAAPLGSDLTVNSLDSWDGRWSVPRWGHKPRPPGGAAAPDPAQAGAGDPEPDAWGFARPDPVRRPARVTPADPAAPDPAASGSDPGSVAGFFVAPEWPRRRRAAVPPSYFAPVLPDDPAPAAMLPVFARVDLRPPTRPRPSGAMPVEPSLLVAPTPLALVPSADPARPRPRPAAAVAAYLLPLPNATVAVSVTRGTPYHRRVTARLFRRDDLRVATWPQRTHVKGVGETRTIPFAYDNFPEIQAGQTIASAVVTGNPSGLTIGAAAASAAAVDGIPAGQAILCVVSGGTEGQDYTLTCLATTSAGNVLEVRGVLSVSDGR